jgi:tetratricopeptide (TPR) repeat protein
VHQSCAALARTPVDGELAASAALHSAQCYRALGERALAQDAYQRAAAVGRAWQAEYTVLTARVGLANLAADGGDLAAADDQLAVILADTETESTREVRAHAWHDRAAVAHRRGHKAESIEYAYEAWVATREPAIRERILRDLAAVALAAGYRDAARDASAVLATTAKKAWVRWLATINLMALATLDRLESEFTRLRRGLSEVPLPPVIEAEYLYSAALGDYAFGRRTAAVDGLRRAVTIARDHRLDQVLQRAESALATVRTGTAPPVHGPTATPERLARVSAALSNARMMVSARDNQMHPLRGVVDGTR